MQTVLKESSVETSLLLGMKRFACHYLYLSAEGCYSKYVVELEDNDKVKVFFPLKEELSATQWIGGVIVISPLCELEIHSGEKFSDFLRRVIVETETDVPMYAWHIADFDLAKKEFAIASKPVRL